MRISINLRLSRKKPQIDDWTSGCEGQRAKGKRESLITQRADTSSQAFFAKVSAFRLKKLVMVESASVACGPILADADLKRDNSIRSTRNVVRYLQTQREKSN